jgi:hypothetical protein
MGRTNYSRGRYLFDVCFDVIVAMVIFHIWKIFFSVLCFLVGIFSGEFGLVGFVNKVIQI